MELILIFIGLILLSAFFSGTETAYFNVKTHRENVPKKVLSLLNDPRKLLVSLLAGNTFVNITIASLAAYLTHEYAQENQWSETVLILVEVLIVSVVVLIFGEIFPKLFAIRNSEKFAEKVYLPLKFIILPKKDDEQPCIFSPGQISNLMVAAASQDPGMVPYLALGIFAGVRPEELMRLGWEDITTHGVSINGHKAKTRQRRLITISENLKGWLSLGGDLPPKSRRRRLEALRQNSGVPWGHDIMRHSFASYHLAYHGSPDRTAHELGHRDTQMLYRHYRQLVTREAAETFWAIRPQLCNKD